MSTPAALSSIVRKLHRWELLHLRELVAELHAENEHLRRELDYANDCAESWRDDVLRLSEDGAALGLTQDGHVHLLACAGPLLTNTIGFAA